MKSTIIFSTSDLISFINQEDWEGVETLIHDEPYETKQIDSEGIYNSQDVYSFMRKANNYESWTTLIEEARIKFNNIIENL